MKTPPIRTATLLLGITMLLGWACTEIYDFERFSGMISYDPEVDAPLVRGSLTAEDLFAAWDSLMENNGDTVVLVFREDSLFHINAEDFSGIPPQDTSEFNLLSPYISPVMLTDSLAIDSTENYALTLDNNMRADSVYINEGFLFIHVNSSFRHAGTLDILCPDVYMEGRPFHRKIRISSTDGMFAMDTLFPLNNATVYVDNSIPGQPFIKNNYHLVLLNNPGQGIGADDRVRINYSIVELDQYEVMFGFAGNEVYEEDTVFSTGLEAIKGLSGTFTVIDPRIRFNYASTFGFPVGLDLYIQGYFRDGKTVNLNPPLRVMDGSENYLLPLTEGRCNTTAQTYPTSVNCLLFQLPTVFPSQEMPMPTPG
jgi:hypothetical protein